MLMPCDQDFLVSTRVTCVQIITPYASDDMARSPLANSSRYYNEMFVVWNKSTTDAVKTYFR